MCQKIDSASHRWILPHPAFRLRPKKNAEHYHKIVGLWYGVSQTTDTLGVRTSYKTTTKTIWNVTILAY